MVNSPQEIKGKVCTRAQRYSLGNSKEGTAPAALKSKVQITGRNSTGGPNSTWKVKDRLKQEETTKTVPAKIADQTNVDITVQS